MDRKNSLINENVNDDDDDKSHHDYSNEFLGLPNFTVFMEGTECDRSKKNVLSKRKERLM
jgi:hypothetical protein